MAGGFVLAHLSDLHLGPLERSPLGLLNAKRVLGAANWHRARRHVHDPRVAELAIAEIHKLGADHIAISGDLCNLGLPAEHERALEALRRWGGEGRISVVPGNHDIYSRIGRD
ncbi:MAG TPA: metallophosphoesterase, partial [Azospirillaceae bacterium]|nr:metallophosphoesterase [Azospirillaceae bacterium]